jgi:hypothetical protein
MAIKAIELDKVMWERVQGREIRTGLQGWPSGSSGKAPA